MSEKTGKYLYCFIKAGESEDIGEIGPGQGEQPVYTVHHRDMAAVVSDSAEEYYDPVGKNAMCHQNVISAVMAKHEVVPVRFGVICKSMDALNKLLEEIYPAVMTNLERLHNKMEVGLKLFWTRDSFVKEVGESNEEVVALKNKIVELGPDKGYLLMIELGERLQKIADEKRLYYIENIYRGLQKEAVESRLNDIVGERMVLNAAFLVDKAGEEQFDLAVNRFYDIYGRTLEFKYTGPWPPYNFIDVKVD
ncbi:gas vesicle synthesis GvpL [Desulfocucumis palustris]|uniref:Gas vesicle synthesis GvpL n=1 Tax=Desulfocucumis palustris TaxID=1898651 RepID=A0A2L2X8V6_9FIRM|nr:GvpL/GvpF family gas vesicle protein [Desulfocucumis palustris]GBF32442.1 gas vesicle synthesis GvpL [Desulfocucumis palustris]